MSEGKKEEDRPRPAGPEGNPGQSPPGSETGTPKEPGSSPTGLTERQRRQARELRRRRERSGHRRVKRTGSSPGNTVSRGFRATAVETGRALTFLGKGVRTAAGRVGSFLLIAVEALLVAGVAILSGVRRVLAVSAAAAARAALALDRILTPAVAVTAAVVLAAVMLGVSQFLDYRAVEIGSTGYDPILDLTRAPRTDVETPIAAHSIILVLAAIAALGCCVGLALTGRRGFAIPILAAGVVSLVVGLAIDLPRGLDSAAASVAYADAEPILLSGFWLEIASGVVLTAGGLITVLGWTGAEGRAAADRRKAPRSRGRSGAAAGGAA